MLLKHGKRFVIFIGTFCCVFLCLWWVSFSGFANGKKHHISIIRKLGSSCFKGNNVAWRIQCLTRLARYRRYKESLPFFTRALHEFGIFERVLAARSIPFAQQRDSFFVLSKALRKEKNVFVQKELIVALERHGDARSIPVLHRYSKNQNLLVRHTALQSWSRLLKNLE